VNESEDARDEGEIAGWWSQLHVMYKREREEAWGRWTGGGTLLEINQNVTIFQRLFPYRARLSPHFSPYPLVRLDAPVVHFSFFLFLSLSTASPQRCARENRDKRAKDGYVCRTLEKKPERDSVCGGDGRYVPTRDKTNGGRGGKETAVVRRTGEVNRR